MTDLTGWTSGSCEQSSSSNHRGCWDWRIPPDDRSAVARRQREGFPGVRKR